LTSVLLSIKPKYADAIMDGSKGYEFRKSLFRNGSIERVFVYSTSPVQMVVGAFEIGGIIHDHPENLWETLHGCAGIDEIDFFRYFAGRSEGFAIEVKGPQEFGEPVDPWALDPTFVPPQSFRYVDWVLSRGGGGVHLATARDVALSPRRSHQLDSRVQPPLRTPATSL